MSGYGYAPKGYSTYTEIEPTTYQGYVSNDHVCRPVIVDAEGRKQPIISYNSPGYVTKRETIIERVHTPAGQYSYNSPPKLEVFNDYGVNNNDKWRRPSSPIRDQRYPQEWQTTTSPTYGYGHQNGGTNGYGSEWTKPKSHQLTTPTNNIGEAVDFLRHAITAVPQAQSWVQKIETYAEPIDSREASRRYARPTFKKPVNETYMGNIDSRR